jgi:hypothetical protein
MKQKGEISTVGMRREKKNQKKEKHISWLLMKDENGSNTSSNTRINIKIMGTNKATKIPLQYME